MSLPIAEIVSIAYLTGAAVTLCWVLVVMRGEFAGRRPATVVAVALLVIVWPALLIDYIRYLFTKRSRWLD